MHWFDHLWGYTWWWPSQDDGRKHSSREITFLAFVSFYNWDCQLCLILLCSMSNWWFTSDIFVVTFWLGDIQHFLGVRLPILSFLTSSLAFMNWGRFSILKLGNQVFTLLPLIFCDSFLFFCWIFSPPQMYLDTDEPSWCLLRGRGS